MEINDGKGIFDKYGLINELLREMNTLAGIMGDNRKNLDRCGMVWSIANGLSKLGEGLKKDDLRHDEETRILKNRVCELEKAVKK